MSKAECFAVAVAYAVIALVFGNAAVNAEGWADWLACAIICWAATWVACAYGTRLISKKAR